MSETSCLNTLVTMDDAQDDDNILGASFFGTVQQRDQCAISCKHDNNPSVP
jgi:hypothetical protein